MRVAAIAVFALAACQTPCPPVERGPVNLTYLCEDGSVLNVTISGRPETANITQEGYAPLVLPVELTASGYRYADSGAELRGRGGEAWWTRPGAAETLCRVRADPSTGAPPQTP
jgi:hypothetical protein